MIQIPEQVKDAPIVRMKNAVLVGTMKFTLDRFDASFDAEENPAPPRLAAQLAEFRTSYDALNAAYALTRESLITQDIAALRRAHLPAEQQHRLREDSCHDEGHCVGGRGRRRAGAGRRRRRGYARAARVNRDNRLRNSYLTY